MTVVPEGETAIISADTYHVTPVQHLEAMIHLGDGLDWPVIAKRMDAVRIRYVAGFGDTAADIPADIKNALLQTIAYLDANRGDCGCGDEVIPASARAMVQHYRNISFSVT